VTVTHNRFDGATTHRLPEILVGELFLSRAIPYPVPSIFLAHSRLSLRAQLASFVRTLPLYDRGFRNNITCCKRPVDSTLRHSALSEPERSGQAQSTSGEFQPRRPTSMIPSASVTIHLDPLLRFNRFLDRQFRSAEQPVRPVSAVALSLGGNPNATCSFVCCIRQFAGALVGEDN
jgi:hypothetical protein